MTTSTTSGIASAGTAHGATSGTPLSLDVRAVAKSYGRGPATRQILADVTFAVHQGEFVTVVGPSGAGKTTLLRCLAGLLAPDAGEVALHGQKITAPPKGLSLVFQDYSRSLLPWMSVLRNVMLPLRRLGSNRAERLRLAEQALEAVGLADAGSLYPWQMSGGMQQRAAIARAVACQPQVLLMDEPFASVDAQTRADLEDLMLRLRDELRMTIVLVTHDIDEAVYLADRIIVLSGAPTSVTEIIAVPLPAPRDQLRTKLEPAFAELRAHVLGLIRR
ncbi:ABC transporter ATP-binding protein [Rhodococcus jostii]|uniref:NitT/TauT family transport system ATP-binding protein n=1 Tax=Rhodococcus jostii TaxID=132919 RepID=A0A1H5M8Y7_RHOJO|nr:ABC transporter ATP-binding protein [Rhodococcus jostii]SEE85600.1 NitT/TauT family transport system ATP-binding protein [Rhodococcus jostii]